MIIDKVLSIQEVNMIERSCKFWSAKGVFETARNIWNAVKTLEKVAELCKSHEELRKHLIETRDDLQEVKFYECGNLQCSSRTNDFGEPSPSIDFFDEQEH